VRLVNHEVLPRKALQHFALVVGHFVGRDTNIPGARIVRIVVHQLAVLVHDLPIRATTVVRCRRLGEEVVDHVLALLPVTMELDHP
jgi:hypothetical protein